jgi:two-component system, NtrC family, nitrogen regulation sensor histidine kinase NtrY
MRFKKNAFMETNHELKRKILIFIMLCLASFGGIMITRYYSNKEKDHVLITEKYIEKILREKEQRLQNILETILKDEHLQLPFLTLNQNIQPELWQKEGISVFLYRNDTLIFWSNNNVPAQNIYTRELFVHSFLHYGNGWFRVVRAEKAELDAVGLILIKNDFPYQNKYLVNDFQKEFRLESEDRLDTIPGKLNIHSEDGQFLFSVSEVKSQSMSYKACLLVFVLWTVFIISLVILLFYIYNLFVYFRVRPFLLLLAFFIDATLLRFILLYFEIPRFIYETDLFSPYYYATSMISPSLGDLVINSLFWLTLAWIFFSKFKFRMINYKGTGRVLASLLMSLISGGLYYLLLSTMRKLVVDSNIELNLNNIFNIDIYSGLGFLSLTALTFAFFLVSSRLNCVIIENKIKNWQYAIIIIAASLLTYLLFSKEQNTGTRLTYAGLLFIYLLSFLYFAKRPKGFRNVTGALVYIILFSLISTIVLDIYHNSKEKETRKIIAAGLSSQRDPLMEYEYSRLADQIVQDSSLVRMLKNWTKNKDNEGLIIQTIRERYMSSFWNNYDLLITICKKEDMLNIQPGNYLTNCDDYFNERFTSPGSEYINDGLYFLYDRMGSNNYIAGLDFVIPNENVSEPLNIFIEIYHKYIYETGLGYPDLLIDKKVKLISGLDDYSYAKYTEGKLIYKNGDFSYRLGFQPYNRNDESSYFIDIEGYSHYIVKSDKDNTLIISKKGATFLDVVAPFSYLFILFSLFLLVFLSGYLISGGIRYLEFNFSNQLQVSIISIIIIAFFILGIITRANIIHLYTSKNRDNLSEKTFSVLTELEHKLGAEPGISDDLQPYISDLLFKFSSIFYSDINLFDTHGSLIASSRQQIFDEELLSEKMNTSAFYKLSVGQSLLYIQNEKIGRQEYLSAYIPFRNNEDKIIAYLNLPYFAKQTELKKEIGDFLAAYINVYVLLIVLAIVVTIVVSRLISRPLQLIGEKLSVIGFGKPNEKIVWKRKDEIGKLVEEYNRMIDELVNSAELLAKSEREGAWREMAKQVAHEIKNPLTPMKLSVQYLQKAWNEKTPDWEKHLARFTQTIVEQIDSLSEIASEFSDFAKMPVASIEKTSLTEIIKTSSELFRHHRHVAISSNPSDREYYVMADRKQLLRVFNNLITNSIQAIGKKTDGLISINISEEDDFYIVRISDNGTGISDEQAGKIFSPSFTTKSSGMGLGLSMAKSILTSVNATINFESKPGEGTTFIIRIPACRL